MVKVKIHKWILFTFTYTYVCEHEFENIIEINTLGF